jgi:hypothetical protein
MDFRMEMAERIDGGMDEMDAYYETRDSFASFSDNREKISNICPCDMIPVCNCTCDPDCECKQPGEK